MNSQSKDGSFGGSEDTTPSASARPLTDDEPSALEQRAPEQDVEALRATLDRARADLQNLTRTSGIAAVFLDGDLRVVRLTAAVGALLGVHPVDRGQPFADLARHLGCEELGADAQRVLATRTPAEGALRTKDDRRIRTRLAPYRATDGRVDGVVVTFEDVTAQVRAEAAARRRESRFRRAIADAPVPVFLHAEGGEILAISRTLTEITGYAADDLPTLDAWLRRAYSSERAQHVAADIDRLYDLDQRVDEGEYRIRTADGEERIWLFSSSPIGTDGQGRRLVVSMAADITERKRIEGAFEAHAAQQAALADFGLYALTETDLDVLFERAVAVVQRTLGSDYSKILQLQPGGDALLLRTGLGWHDGLVGSATVSTDTGSQAGYTLTVSDPVIVQDLATEHRFRGPDLLIDHGVVSGLSVVIGGLAEPFGVFGTHTRTPRAFSDTDARFLQSVANIVASATERIEAHEHLEEQVEQRTRTLRESESRLRLLYDVISHPYESFNEQVDRALQRTAELLGLDVGILSHIEGDTYTAIRCYAPGTSLRPGQTYALADTPCALTLKARKPLAIDRLSTSEHSGHPCREVFGIESYAGAPVRVDGTVYGTLNFTGPEPKEPPFSEGDRELLALLAQWLGSAMAQARAEAALRDAKEQTDRIIESSFDGIIGFDRDLRYTVWNAGMERITGVPRTETLGRISYEVFPFITADGELERQRAALAGKAISSGPLPYVIPQSGNAGFYESRYAPLRDDDGEVVGVLGMVRDVTERKRAQDEVARSEQLLAGMLLGSLEGIVGLEAVRDGSGSIVDFEFLVVNPAAAGVYGRHAEDLIGTRYLDRMPGTVEKGVFEALVQVTETGEPFREEVFYDVDDISGWYDYTVVKLGDGVALTFRDITERKKAEKAVRESEARFRELFESSPDAIFVETLAGIVLDVNPAACRLHNTTREWLIGRDLRELVPPAYRERAQGDFERLARGEIGLLESRSYTADGLIVPVEVRTDRITYAGQEAVLLHVRDVTEREAAERALRESEERFAKAFRSAPVAMTISTFNENRYLDVNDSYCALTGYTRDELLGRTSTELGITRGTAPEIPGFDLLDESGHVREIEFPIHTKAGEARDVLVSAELIEIGGLTCVLGIGLDVTDRKRLERDVIEAAEQERRRIGQDLHDELGQQLTGAAFLSEVLAQQLATDDRAEAESARQLTDLINDVLAETRDLSRLLSPVDVFADGLADALQTLADQAERIFDVFCTFETEGDVRVADNAAATHLYRIAQEAVNNAVKHAAPSLIRISLWQRTEGLRLRIEDDGVGIEPAAVEQPNGIGLRTMRYRASLIGGVIRIGQTAAGSEVSILVPDYKR